MVTTGSALSWTAFVEQTRNRPPRPLLVEAIPFVSRRNRAIDLGAGALNDAKLMLREDFKEVIALDAEPVAKAIASKLRADHFSYVISTLEGYAFPPRAFDLINAQFVLPFVAPDQFARVFAAIVDALEEGGIFCGQLFGDHDEWRADPKMNFHDPVAARSLFRDLDIIAFREEQSEGITAAGEMKHWHIFHFIAAKPGP